jgi:hypothetical protein
MGDIRSQACVYLRNGLVDLLEVVGPDGTSTGQWRNAASHVRAVVNGHASRYEVALVDGMWSCTCSESAPCPHAAAVQTVTGWPSLARRAAKR